MRCLLFVVCCCSLCVDCWLRFGYLCDFLCVACGSLVVVVVCCSLFVVGLFLLLFVVVCCLLVLVCCLLFCVRSVLFGV